MTMATALVLPEGFYFLQTGWWIFHIIAISFFTLTGYVIGRRYSAEKERELRGKEAYNIVQIPSTYRFLNSGWWVIHLIAIPFVFILGYILWP